MVYHIMVLPDGSEIKSGAMLDPVILQLQVTEKVNTETELTFGAVCSAMVEATVWATAGCPVSAGDQVTLYRVTEAGDREKVGIFTMEKPTGSGGCIYKLTAYDAVRALDRDLTQFLSGLQGWPYSILSFAQLVCAECGLTLKNKSTSEDEPAVAADDEELSTDLPNGDFPVQQFTAKDVTGRQLLSWVAEATGSFCRADADGVLELTWYEAADQEISPSGENFYYTGSLSYEDYRVAAIDKVVVRWESGDVGTGWPEDLDGENVYIIEGNPLLIAQDATTLLPVAQTLYERLLPVTYTPCKVSIPDDRDIRAGQILPLTTLQGNVLTMYVMECVTQGGKRTISCTGSADRSAASSAAKSSYKALSGKVLRMQKDVDGIRAENADTTGKLAKLTMDIDGITAEVSQQEAELETMRQSVTLVEQSAQQVKISVEQIQQEGVSRVTTKKNYTFDEKGLNISGSDGMENLLDETGMHVRRSGQALLLATKDGVDATDVTVRNYLVIGKHARFEDYTDGTDSKRTACFSLEE